MSLSRPSILFIIFSVIIVAEFFIDSKNRRWCFVEELKCDDVTGTQACRQISDRYWVRIKWRSGTGTKANPKLIHMWCIEKMRRGLIDCPYQVILLIENDGKRQRLYYMHKHTCGFRFDDKQQVDPHTSISRT